MALTRCIVPFQEVIGSLRAGYTVVAVASKRHEARVERWQKEGGLSDGIEGERERIRLASERTNIDGRYVLSWTTNPRAALD